MEKKTKKKPKSENVSVRLSKDEKRLLRERVPAGTSMSAWIREQAIQAPPKGWSRTMRRRVQQLARLSNHLTEVARRNAEDPELLLLAKAMEALVEELA